SEVTMDETSTPVEPAAHPGPVSVDADDLFVEGDPIHDTKAPDVPAEQMWDQRQFDANLVNPANRRKLSVIIVGTGLAQRGCRRPAGQPGADDDHAELA